MASQPVVHGTQARRRQRGLTIVETLIAATILAVGIVSLTNLLGASARLNQSGREKEAALAALGTQVAALQSADFDDLAALDGADFAAGAATEGSGLLLRPPAGDADLQAGEIAVTAPTGEPLRLLELVVSVTWQGANGVHTLARRVRRSRLGS
ncbi:MAG: prepilin-type N-terminal cleavage/methylation domain-containing protein [Planctomycetes bacterium]|nr:prepilin-type N-terminal cleavage/methylation domain-containing protein [Planctomycetota bacterium]